jgi:hypothetical protein
VDGGNNLISPVGAPGATNRSTELGAGAKRTPEGQSPYGSNPEGIILFGGDEIC